MKQQPPETRRAFYKKGTQPGHYFLTVFLGAPDDPFSPTVNDVSGIVFFRGRKNGEVVLALIMFAQYFMEDLAEADPEITFENHTLSDILKMVATAPDLPLEEKNKHLLLAKLTEGLYVTPTAGTPY